MSDAFASMDRSAFDGFRNSDERALEQVVRHGFPTLAAVAAADAADDAAAARVIEGAFIEAWGERATFQSPESLETFLRQAVHRGAVRERSRRAALHRFEAHEGVTANALPRNAAGAPLTADELWSRVNTVLHTPRPTQESTQRIRADVSRHEAASHVANIAKHQTQGSSVMLMALVAVVVLGAIAGLAWFLQPSGVSDARLDSAIAAGDARLRSTEAGQRAAVELLDGTQVMLGAASKLRIPREFGDRLRGVGLEGTASFDVTPNPERVFVVRAGAAHVRVTGTKFDIAAFPADDMVVVRVREGSVVVAAGEASQTVAAGDAVTVDSDGDIADAGSQTVEEAIGWADGQFVVVDRPLREVVPLMNRWYRLDLNVTEERLLDRKATVRAPINSSRQAIEAVEASAKVKFGYEGENKNKVLRDAAAK
jgi:transmembrane sensor